MANAGPSNAHAPTPLRRVVGVIGPTNVARVAAAAGLPSERYVATARAVGRLLAERGERLLIVPDRGIAVEAALGYREGGGPEKSWRRRPPPC